MSAAEPITGFPSTRTQPSAPPSCDGMSFADEPTSATKVPVLPARLAAELHFILAPVTPPRLPLKTPSVTNARLAGENAAVTVRACDMVTLQTNARPEQSPVQPAK